MMSPQLGSVVDVGAPQAWHSAPRHSEVSDFSTPMPPSSALGESRQRGVTEMQYASEVEILPLPRDAMLNELLWLIIHSSWLWDCLLQCVWGEDVPKERTCLGGWLEVPISGSSENHSRWEGAHLAVLRSCSAVKLAGIPWSGSLLVPVSGL